MRYPNRGFFWHSLLLTVAYLGLPVVVLRALGPTAMSEAAGSYIQPEAED